MPEQVPAFKHTVLNKTFTIGLLTAVTVLHLFEKGYMPKTKDKAVALRQAMLLTMEKHPNPRDRAAFTLIGEAQ